MACSIQPQRGRERNARRKRIRASCCARSPCIGSTAGPEPLHPTGARYSMGGEPSLAAWEGSPLHGARVAGLAPLLGWLFRHLAMHPSMPLLCPLLHPLGPVSVAAVAVPSPAAGSPTPPAGPEQHAHGPEDEEEEQQRDQAAEQAEAEPQEA